MTTSIEDRVGSLERALLAAGLASLPGEGKIEQPSATLVAALRHVVISLARERRSPAQLRQLARKASDTALLASKERPGLPDDAPWAHRHADDIFDEIAAIFMAAASD